MGLASEAGAWRAMCTNRRSRIMSKGMKPTHRAYKVTERGKDKKPIWHRVGSVWPYESGKGFNLVIPEGISVTGKIVCIEVSEDTHSAGDADDIPL